MSLLTKYYLNQLSKSDLGANAKLAAGDTKDAPTPIPSPRSMGDMVAGSSEDLSAGVKSASQDAINKLRERRAMKQAAKAPVDAVVAGNYEV